MFKAKIQKFQRLQQIAAKQHAQKIQDELDTLESRVVLESEFCKHGAIPATCIICNKKHISGRLAKSLGLLDE